jgi:hypothetical protein
MAMYKVLFSGYALVEADSEEEAEELFYDDEWGIIETDIDNILECGD